MALTKRELAMPAWAVWEERQRQRYLDRANLPDRAGRVRVTDLTDRVREVVDAFLDEVRVGEAYRGLLLWGKPGRGKTTAALAALTEALTVAPHEWLGRGPGMAIPPRSGYCLSYAEFLRQYKESWGDGEEATDARDMVRSIFCSSSAKPGTTCRVLVLDDVGKEHHSGTGFNVTVLHDLLRSRWDRSAPTIITTNVMPDEWKPQYGDAMASFIQEGFRMVEVKGADRRAQ